MVIQFLGHRDDGCLDWFDVTEPTCTTPTPTPTPTPNPCRCLEDIGMGTGSSLCAENECCFDCDCMQGYWGMDAGDCVCYTGDIGEGIIVDPPQGTLLNNPMNLYAWTTWTLCCQERDASGFPPCQGWS
jgi:hypothetical protein